MPFKLNITPSAFSPLLLLVYKGKAKTKYIVRLCNNALNIICGGKINRLFLDKLIKYLQRHSYLHQLNICINVNFKINERMQGFTKRSAIICNSFTFQLPIKVQFKNLVLGTNANLLMCHQEFVFY